MILLLLRRKALLIRVRELPADRIRALLLFIIVIENGPFDRPQGILLCLQDCRADVPVSRPGGIPSRPTWTGAIALRRCERACHLLVHNPVVHETTIEGNHVRQNVRPPNPWVQKQVRALRMIAHHILRRGHNVLHGAIGRHKVSLIIDVGFFIVRQHINGFISSFSTGQMSGSIAEAVASMLSLRTTEPSLHFVAADEIPAEFRELLAENGGIWTDKENHRVTFITDHKKLSTKQIRILEYIFKENIF